MKENLSKILGAVGAIIVILIALYLYPLHMIKDKKTNEYYCTNIFNIRVDCHDN